MTYYWCSDSELWFEYAAPAVVDGSIIGGGMVDWFRLCKSCGFAPWLLASITKLPSSPSELYESQSSSELDNTPRTFWDSYLFHAVPYVIHSKIHRVFD